MGVQIRNTRVVQQKIQKLISGDDYYLELESTYHRIIRMKLLDVKSGIYIDFDVKNSDKILNWKSMIMLEYQNIKKKLPKFTLQIGRKNFLRLKKLKKLPNRHL